MPGDEIKDDAPMFEDEDDIRDWMFPEGYDIESEDFDDK